MEAQSSESRGSGKRSTKESKTRLAEKSPEKTTPEPVAKQTTPAPASEAKTRLAEKSPTKASPAPVAKLTTPAPAEPKIHLAEKSSAKATSNQAEAMTRLAEKNASKATPAPITKLAPLIETTPTKSRTAEVRATPAPKLALAPAITAIPPSRTVITSSSSSSKTRLIIESIPEASSNRVSGRYPWKSNIVTTVFWVGEPVSGNNFTPNYASSWDASWSRTYGGFDNPDPAARRNYIPVKFVPQQNPFYCALPYNDVTRGTTKPESRRCIPWFREAFQREGQSVCRNRWVAIRNRAGKVAYAQWSDCGPFRTDHWQYVFGSERPKPNLNGGAGLDVSPAVRDYLGLSSTDVTDWKFIDTKDVPHGPWALYGDNNTLASKNSRGSKSASSRSGGNAGSMRVSEL